MLRNDQVQRDKPHASWIVSLLVTVFVASIAGPAQAFNIPFSAQLLINITLVNPGGVAVGDIDGDGDLDVLSASSGDDKIVWHENTAGNGSAWAPHTISAVANAARTVAVGDIDGDGDLDVLSASSNDDTVAWYSKDNASSNSTWTEHDISTTTDGALAIAVSDIDLDGDPDVVVAAINSNRVVWFENPRIPTGNVNGTWASHIISAVVTGADNLALGDIDGDGDIDVATASRGTPDRLAWYENRKIPTGSASGTWTQHQISTVTQNTHAVAVGDVDGDGDLDVLSASFNNSLVAWHENTLGNGSSWTIHNIDTAAASPLAMAAADLDGDGDLDALVGNTNSVVWDENTAGDGSAWSKHTISTAVNSVLSVVTGDLDKDGDLDVLSASNGDDKVAWYRSDRDGVRITPVGGFTTTEAGGTAQFNVVLNRQPAGGMIITSVTFPVTTTDLSEGKTSVSQLTFNNLTWNIPLPLTITGQDDASDDGDIAYQIKLGPFTSPDSQYAALAPIFINLTNIDNDTAGVTVTPTNGLTTTEAGGSAQFTVKLNSQPTANVSIALATSDATEGVANKVSLTFTTANWNVAQTVTVTGQDDAVFDGNVAYKIVLGPITSADPKYSAIDPTDVSLTNNDNEIPLNLIFSDSFE